MFNLAGWLDQVREATGEIPLEITWKPFSLEQVNQKVGPDYHAWAEPDEALNPSLWGLRAGVAAGRQGPEALRAFLPLLLRARHERRMELNDAAGLRALAQEAGLDVARFEADLADRSTLDEIAASHAEAREMGVFGTPTIVAEGGYPVFLKMIRPRTGEEAAAAWEGVKGLIGGLTFVAEVKRPQPPWPKGIFD